MWGFGSIGEDCWRTRGGLGNYGFGVFSLGNWVRSMFVGGGWRSLFWRFGKLYVFLMIVIFR